MCILDALIFNPDRHYGNFGVRAVWYDTMKVQKMAPIFDHNRSWFPELDVEELAKPEWYMQKCRPRIGKDFIVTARGLLTSGIKQDLKNLDNFCFQTHTSIQIPQPRIEALNSIVYAQFHADVGM